MRYSPERLYHYSTRVFGTARVDLNRPMSFWLLFCSLHFLALVFATISLVCFGVQEKIVGKNSCSGVSWFSNAPLFCTIYYRFMVSIYKRCECMWVVAKLWKVPEATLVH